MKKELQRRVLKILAAIFLIATALTPIIVIAQGSQDYGIIWSDDFEDGTLNNWNVVSGSWEIITEGGNHFVHCNRTSTPEHRRMVSKDAIGGDVTIKAKVKGDATYDVADTSIGFYSNSEGSSYYFVCIGSNGDYLAIYKMENGIQERPVENRNIKSENNKWYYIKIKLEGGNISAKRWEVGEIEPLAWQISYDNAIHYGNHIIIGTVKGQQNEEYWFDEITINGRIEEQNIPITEIVIVTSAAAGAAVLLGFLATEWGKYKFLSFLPLLGPLYLRTVKEEVFDNQKRLCMYDHIAENQPVVYSEIKKTCNLSDGEINWHAYMMIQLDLIKTERKGFHLFFYLAKSPRLSPNEFIRLTDIQRSILDLIAKKPGILQAEIVEKIGLKQQNISYNLLKLEEKDKIRVEKKGKIKFYYPIEKDSSST